MLTEVAAITDYQPTLNKRRRNDPENADMNHAGAVAKQAANVPSTLAYVSNSQLFRRNEFESTDVNHAGSVAKQAPGATPGLASVSNSQTPASSAHMPPEFPMAQASAQVAAMSDWDLTNLLLAHMNYMQTNSAYPYPQQFQTGHQALTPTSIPGQREYPQDMSGIYNNGNGLPAATQSQALDDPFAIWWDIPNSFTRCAPFYFL
jgi:hypothetical protein